MISASQITSAIRDLGVRPGDALFVHSGLWAALRVAGPSPREKLVTIVNGLNASVPDGVLMLPTFSYSFCKGHVFDIDHSPSTVGALTEHFRRLPGVRRTSDPIFSAAVRGDVPAAWEEALFAVDDKDCFGDRSVFAFLRERNARLLFFGVSFEACTFVHHVEQGLGVRYRYMKDFPGVIRTSDTETEITARYFVRDLEDDVVSFFEPLAEALVVRGAARSATLPDGPTLFLTDAESVEATAKDRLRANPSFLLARGHDRDEVRGGRG